MVIDHRSGQNAFQQTNAGVSVDGAGVVIGFNRDDDLALGRCAVNFYPGYGYQASLNGRGIGGVGMNDGAGDIHGGRLAVNR